MAHRDDLSEEDWLILHHRGDRVTASQVPTILGVNKFESPFTLFQRKKGRVPWQDETRAMRRGHHMEGFIAEEFERQEDIRLVDPGDYRIYYEEDFERLTATPDRLTLVEEKNVVEFKAPGIYAVRNWDDGPPLAYMVQVQAQLFCTGGQRGWIAGLVGDDLLVEEYERDDEFIEAMKDKVNEFLLRLANDDAPPIDGSASTTTTIKELHPNDNDLTVELTQDAVERAGRLWDAKAAIKEQNAIKSEQENWFKDQLGPGAYGEFGDLKVSYKTVERKGYTVKPSTHRRLNVAIKK